MNPADLVRAYEKAGGRDDLPAEQRLERAERQTFKQERLSLRRTGRTRGIVVPELPWLKKESE